MLDTPIACALGVVAVCAAFLLFLFLLDLSTDAAFARRLLRRPPAANTLREQLRDTCDLVAQNKTYVGLDDFDGKARYAYVYYDKLPNSRRFGGACDRAKNRLLKPMSGTDRALMAATLKDVRAAHLAWCALDDTVDDELGRNSDDYFDAVLAHATDVLDGLCDGLRNDMRALAERAPGTDGPSPQSSLTDAAHRARAALRKAGRDQDATVCDAAVTTDLSVLQQETLRQAFDTITRTGHLLGKVADEGLSPADAAAAAADAETAFTASVVIIEATVGTGTPTDTASELRLLATYARSRIDNSPLVLPSTASATPD